MAVKYVYGDLLNMLDQFDVVLHGCNIYHTMGAGIAKQFREKHPHVYEADMMQTAYGDENKLGKFSIAYVNNTVILNCYTQKIYSGNGQHVNYDAIRNVMKLVKARYTGKRIGMPCIGAGLAGGNWDYIFEIIKENLGDEDVTVVKFNK